MISQDDLVQQLLELDAEIAAAAQRQQMHASEVQSWSSGHWDSESAALSGHSVTDASQSIQRLRDQCKALARQIETLPDLE